MCRKEVNYICIDYGNWLTDEERLHLWFQASEKEERKTTNNKLLGKDSLHAGKFPNLETCEIQWQKDVNGK